MASNKLDLNSTSPCRPKRRCGRGHGGPTQAPQRPGFEPRLARIAALIPPPRIQRHRYYGVLAPNSPLRAAAVAMAQAQLPADETVVDVPVIGSGGGGSPARASQTEPVAPKRASAARYLWAALMARIYEVFPLLCPQCGGRTAPTRIELCRASLTPPESTDREFNQRIATIAPRGRPEGATAVRSLHC